MKENVTLFVGGFDEKTHPDDIDTFLQRWGAVESFRLAQDHRTKRHRSYGFVRYKTLEVTKKALKDSNIYTLGGRKIFFNTSKN